MIVEVKLYGETLGQVEWNENRKSAVFQYSTDAIKRSIEPSPILMPLEERSFETTRDHINFHNLPYLLSDSMPDDFGNVMMKEWLRQRQLSYDEINPVDRLTYIGSRGMGALEYIPVNHKENKDYQVNITELLDVAKKVLEGKKETVYNEFNHESLLDILRIGTSVGGARAKALLALQFDNKGDITEIRPGDIIQPNGFSYWIMKFDGANEKTLGESEGKGKIEFAYYLMAKKAGIEMTECRLMEENNRFHFLTKRFDRTDNAEKLHTQTLGALAGIDYKIQKASSYETLFRVMKRLGLPYNQLEQQYRRMLFNVVARNHDDHVKNFSFIMDNAGKWKITPTYDLTFQYKPEGLWTDVHQSSINGKFDNFTKNDLVEFGKTFGIKKTNNILEEVINAVSNWSEMASEMGISKPEIDYIFNHHRLKFTE
ncbi:MAG: type II toxin-antitoxin system HipA family toxin [Paludibacter sp.]